VDTRKGKTIKEVLGEFNDAHALVMSMVKQIPPETLRQTGTIPCSNNCAMDRLG